MRKNKYGFIIISSVMSFLMLLSACKWSNDQANVLKNEKASQSQSDLKDDKDTSSKDESSSENKDDDTKVNSDTSSNEEAQNTSNADTNNQNQPSQTTQNPIENQTPANTKNDNAKTQRQSNPKPVHTHSYSQHVTHPTCTSGGYTTYVCSCSHSYTANHTGALGHSFSDFVVVRQPTTSQEGIKQRSCTRCGAVEQIAIPRVVDNSGANFAYANEVIRLVNIHRQNNGLAPLSANHSLNSFALVRSREINQLFSHTRPNGANPANPLNEVLGYGFDTAGENIAKGYPSPQSVVDGWMNSHGHRQNILNPAFSSIGVGCYDANGTLCWTQLFAG